ncbi:ATP-binding protein [Pseudomonas sp. Pseu.R1]|uniref:ATP-binding protein n=1 Tax=Pseudomonas sp. Pseu.R1 TaxID=3379818 RepID=UPI003B9388FA
MSLNFHTSLTQVLLIEDRTQASYATRTVRSAAERVGFDASYSCRVELCVNKLTETILSCKRGGELHIRILPGGNPGVEIVALYLSPAPELQSPMRDGLDTRIQGEVAHSIQNSAEVFDTYTDHRGTVILTRLYPRSANTTDVRFGISQHALRDDPACGDIWEVAIQGKRLSMLMIDGLGHGPDAESAAMAGARGFNRDPFAEPVLLLEEIHNEMYGTRGGVVAVAQFDAAEDRLRFLGIGDIGAVLIGHEKPRGLASYPGIVGNRYRKGGREY